MERYKFYLDVSHSISHIGSDVKGIGVENVMEWVHSDTLFSAIIHAWAKRTDWKTVTGLFKQFATGKNTQPGQNLPFRLSSAFLANKINDEQNNNSKADSSGQPADSNTLYSKDFIEFAPMPLAPPVNVTELERLTKMNFISLKNVLKWLGLIELGCEQAEFIQSLNNDGQSYKKLFIDRIRAVNAKDRRLSQTRVFHRGEVIYTNNTYLYFFADMEENFVCQFKETLQFLAASGGIGGEINIGFSEIRNVEQKHLGPVESSNQYEKFYLLSLLPLEKNINYAGSCYDIINKKSWFCSPFHATQLKKKTVKMLREGSCLRCSGVAGRLVDVTPDKWLADEKKINNWHPVYRNGLGYGIGF